MRYVEKYGTNVQITNDNIAERMRTACWITKAKDTHTHTHTQIRLRSNGWQSGVCCSTQNRYSNASLYYVLRTLSASLYTEVLISPYPDHKQARKHVMDARDFNNIETRAVIKIFPPCKSRRRRKFNAILAETLACFLPSRAKDLSAPLYLITSLPSILQTLSVWYLIRTWSEF